MLTAAPNPRSVLPPPLALPFCTPVTPACRVASCAQSRPFKGVSRTVEALALPHTAGQGSLTKAGGATTRTTCSGLPGWLTTFSQRSPPAEALISLHSCVVNPDAETVISYFPGGRSETL